MANESEWRDFFSALSVWDADPSPDVAVAVAERALAIWKSDPNFKAPSHDALVGQFFHSRGEKNEIVGQGEILAKVEGGYLIELFSWVDGSRNGRKVVPASDVMRWDVYPTHVDMQRAYDEYADAKYGWRRK